MSSAVPPVARLTKLFPVVWLLWAAGCSSVSPKFYPVGIYSASKTADLPEIRQAGFNVVAGPAERAYLDAALTNGLRVLAAPGTSAGSDFDPVAARRTVTAFDSHRALWAWYLVDEPDLNRIPPGAVIRANRFLKSIPAHKPTALVIYKGASALDYANITDLMLIDRYPIPWMPLANFRQHVWMTRLALGAKKPLFAVLQAFDWSYFPELLPGEKNLRPPTYDELRCMAYCALTAGANGLFFYCFNDGRWKMSEHPQLWGEVKKVVAEVNARRALFAAKRIWWPWSTDTFNRADRFNEALEDSVAAVMLHVRVSQPRVPAGYYVVAANTTGKQIGWWFRVPANLAGVVPVFGENRFQQVRDSWLTDSFAPYAVHVYGPLPLR